VAQNLFLPASIHADLHDSQLRKQFATENAYRTHVASKKHRLVEARWAEQQRIQAKTGIVAPHQEDVDEESTSDEDEADEEKVEKAVTKIFEEEEVEEDMSKATPAAPKSVEEIKKEEPTASNPAPAPSQSASEPTKLSHLISEDTPEDEISLTLEQKLLASRALHPTNCLFCTVKSKSIESNLDHMFKAHSFYVPERTFLADVPGFLLYLGEKLAVGNVCLFCEGEFGTLQAVRGHMKDKAHQKIRYETDLDRAEFAEYYDFSTSYPDAEERRVKDMERNQRREARRIRRKEKEERRRKREEELEGDGGWEEVEGDDEKMQGVSDGEEEEEVVVVHESESESEVEDDTDESDFEVSLMPTTSAGRYPDIDGGLVTG
jgi:pre-60S factor REI1